jgi:hypothetical protein
VPGPDGVELPINLRAERATPPFTYTLPENRMVVLERSYNYSWLDAEDYNKSYKNAAIESRFLQDRLEIIENICRTSGIRNLLDEPFILDIDLDYFNTRKSIAPDDPSIFHDLIRKALAITIVRESACVNQLQIQGEGLTSHFLEEAVMQHIGVALTS